MEFKEWTFRLEKREGGGMPKTICGICGKEFNHVLAVAINQLDCCKAKIYDFGKGWEYNPDTVERIATEKHNPA